MSRTFVYTNPNGTSLTISSNSISYLLTSIEGLDISNQTLHEQKAPFQDGTTYIDQLFTPREIVVKGIIRKSQNLSGIDSDKRIIEKALNPKLGPGTITYTNAAGVTRYATGIPEGPIFKNKLYTDPRQEFQITFHCHDPYLYDTPTTVSPSNLAWIYGSNPGYIDSIAYGNGLFVAVSYILTTETKASTNGITWSTGVINNDHYYDIAYGNGLFVTTNASTVTAVSTDGLSWSYGTISNHNWRSITYGNGIFVMVEDGGTNTAISTDGVHWSYGTISNHFWNALSYGNGTFVAICSGSTASYSYDGLTWNDTTISNHFWNALSYGNNKFVALNTSDTTSAYSSDGITWFTGTVSAHGWSSIAFGNTLFVGIGGTSTISTISTDGITWSDISINNDTWLAIAYGNGLFVATDHGNGTPGILKCFSITSLGDYQTPATITITVPGTNPVVNCNDKYIRLVHAFATTDIITINTAFGHKTILKQTSIGATPTNIIQYLDLNSIFWQLIPGVNNITVSNSNSPTTMQVGIIYSEKYIGL